MEELPDPRSTVEPESPDRTRRPGKSFDLSILKTFIGDDEPMTRRLLLQFHSAVSMAESDVQAALDRGDHTKILRIAHQLQSSARYMGAIPLADACQRLEKEFKNPLQSAGIRESRAKILAREIAAVLAELPEQT